MTQKAKFIINGMHCKSCAALIEEHLKAKLGVVSVKVNHDSKKAVIIYEEGKIQKSDLINAMQGVGDYQVEEVQEVPEKLEDNPEEDGGRLLEKKIVVGDASQNHSFLLGLLAGFSIVSTIFNFLMWGLVNKATAGNLGEVKNNAQAQAAPSAPAPTADNQGQQNPPQATVASFNITKDDHIRGDFNAPITLVEFSDFECPFCERHYPTLKKILSDYAGKVRLVYKHFPLSFHPNSQKAAEASECADEQGKFWEYHDKLFENQAAGYSVDKFKKWADELGFNAKKFNDCLDTDKYASKVAADEQEGQNDGVQGTPATFVNGQLVSGAVPLESFKSIIDSLLK